MALSITTQPQDFGRIYDTNRLMFNISSTNYTQPNFRFYIDIYFGDITVNPITWTKIATVRKRPLSNGTCLFNPAELYSNFLSHDLTINATGLQECLKSNSQFYIVIFEEYGDTPEVIIESELESEIIMLYNGLQEYIPYDIVDYGGGNLQWVMTGVTNTVGYINEGTWTNKSTMADSHIIFSGATIQTLTKIQISYEDNNGDWVERLNNITAGDSVRFDGATNENFLISFATLTTTAEYVELSDITFHSKGVAMNDAGFTDNAQVTIFSVNKATNRGTGKWLTDSLNYKVADYDYSNLYFITKNTDKPTHCRLRVWHWTSTNQAAPISPNPIHYMNNSSEIDKQNNVIISAINPLRAAPPPAEEPEPNEPITPNYKVFLGSYYTGFTLTHTSLNNQMYYISTGPKDVESLLRSSWVSYEVDLTDGLLGSSKIWNKYPMYYFKACKDDRYTPWQLFWLNPHGGFDRHTFYKKNYLEYNVERTNWRHRFSDTYVLGERGETVYKTQATQTVILNTDFLTQSEAQILSQLKMSPEVFATYNYKDKVYKIPYVVEDTNFQYKDIKTEKMVVMEIKLRPAWVRTSQKS